MTISESFKSNAISRLYAEYITYNINATLSKMYNRQDYATQTNMLVIYQNANPSPINEMRFAITRDIYLNLRGTAPLLHRLTLHKRLYK